MCESMEINKVPFIYISFPKFLVVNVLISVLGFYCVAKPSFVPSAKTVRKCSPLNTAAVHCKQCENKMKFSILLRRFTMTLFDHTLTELLCKLLQTTQQRHHFYT